MKLYTAHDVVHAAYSAHGVLGDGTPVRRIPCGFPCIDEAVGGLTPGELTVVGARPNVGKSSALLHMAYAMERAGFTPGIISLEDTQITVGERIQAFVSEISSIDIRRSGHTFAGTAATKRTLEASRRLKTQYMFPIGGSCEEVLEGMQALVGSGCDAILVDYLTGIEPLSGKDLRTSYSTIVTRLKQASFELRVPLVLAAQVVRPNRSAGSNDSTEPEMSELGETSFLERKAELVLLFWRDQSRGGVTCGKLAKNKYSRDGGKFEIYQARNGLLTTRPLIEETVVQKSTDE